MERISDLGEILELTDLMSLVGSPALLTQSPGALEGGDRGRGSLHSDCLCSTPDCHLLVHGLGQAKFSVPPFPY